jgi:hypothetical protein
MRPRLAALTLSFAAALLAGCQSSRSQARSAVEAGDLRRALDLYDEALASDPGDESALRERRQARERLALEILTAGERAAMTEAREDAERSLFELCGRRVRWGEPLPGGAALRYEALRDAVLNLEFARVDGLVRGGRYIDAATVGRHEGFRCPDLDPLRRPLVERTAAIAAARCTALEATARAHGPYAQSMAERACLAMGAVTSTHVALPHQVGHVRLDGAVRGASPALLESLRQHVTATVSKTPLFDASAKSELEIAVAGYVRHEIRRTPTTLSHSWTEAIPYQDTETYQESYQEPYTDTEYYTERTPYTRYEYRNGRNTPVTDYRSESRTRTVTKYRTAFRTRTRPVTRYRHEPRVFTHAAVHVEATYESAFSSEIHAPLLRTLPIPVAHTETEDAYEHSASFAPANVSPSSGDVRSLENRFQDDAELVARRFAAAWRTAFTGVACGSGTFRGPEEGARCAWLEASKAPDGAFLALAPIFGADVPALVELPAP